MIPFISNNFTSSGKFSVLSMEKHTFILLHAFKKKTQKLPPHEKEIALKRMEVYLKMKTLLKVAQALNSMLEIKIQPRFQ
jgi:phage-related protein